jgi:hypothetical protein
VTTAGWSPPPASLKRPGIGAKRRAALPCHGPACYAQVTAHRSRSPTSQLKPSVRSPGRATIRSGPARPPPPGAKPSSGGTLSALRAGPPGARPTAGGSRQGSGPPPPRPSSCRPTAARSTHPPPACRVAHQHAKRTCTRGACTLSSRRFRPYAGCSARWPSLGSRRGGPCPASSTPPSGCHPAAGHPRHPRVERGVGKVRSPQLATPMRVASWSQAPGPIAPPRQAADTANDAWQTSPTSSRPSAGRPRGGVVTAIADGAPAANRPPTAWSPWPVHESVAWGPWPNRFP